MLDLFILRLCFDTFTFSSPFETVLALGSPNLILVLILSSYTFEIRKEKQKERERIRSIYSLLLLLLPLEIDHRLYFPSLFCFCRRVWSGINLRPDVEIMGTYLYVHTLACIE